MKERNKRGVYGGGHRETLTKGKLEGKAPVVV